MKTRVAGSLGQGQTEEVRELGGAANVSTVLKSKGLSSFPTGPFHFGSELFQARADLASRARTQANTEPGLCPRLKCGTCV